VIFEKSHGRQVADRAGRKIAGGQPGLCRHAGYTIEEVLLLNFDTITHPDDIAESRECVRSLLANERSDCRMEKRYLHKSGRPIWTDESTTMLRTPRGRRSASLPPLWRSPRASSRRRKPENPKRNTRVLLKIPAIRYSC